MKRMQKKLHSQRGESLVEVLAAVLVAVLSVSMLMGGVAVSGRINSTAQKIDEDFYKTLTQAESRRMPADGITNAEIQVAEGGNLIKIPVQVYGNQGLYAYALPPAGGVGP